MQLQSLASIQVAVPFGPATVQAMREPNGLRETLERIDWIQRCSSRLGELAPQRNRQALALLAADLWNDVHGLSPEMAAEMEHEAGWSDQ